MAVNMRLIDTDIGIMPAAQTHLRGAGRIGAAGPPLQNTGGGQQLWPVADGGDRFTRGVERLYQFNHLLVQTQILRRPAAGITSAS